MGLKSFIKRKIREIVLNDEYKDEYHKYLGLREYEGIIPKLSSLRGLLDEETRDRARGLGNTHDRFNSIDKTIESLRMEMDRMGKMCEMKLSDMRKLNVESEKAYALKIRKLQFQVDYPPKFKIGTRYNKDWIITGVDLATEKPGWVPSGLNFLEGTSGEDGSQPFGYFYWKYSITNTKTGKKSSFHHVKEDYK